MLQIQRKRRLKLANADRDIISENRQNLSHWHESIDNRQEIKSLELATKIEGVQKVREQILSDRKQNVKKNMGRWDKFRDEREVVILNYVRARQMQVRLARFVKYLKLQQALKFVLSQFVKRKEEYQAAKKRWTSLYAIYRGQKRYMARKRGHNFDTLIQKRIRK